MKKLQRLMGPTGSLQPMAFRSSAEVGLAVKVPIAALVLYEFQKAFVPFHAP